MRPAPRPRIHVVLSLALAIAAAVAFRTGVDAQGPAGAPAPAAAPVVPAALAEASTIPARADEYMQAQVRVNHFSGAVLIARRGTPVVSKGYGWANAEWEVPNTPQTKFRLGSITKQFTAAAVLRLQDQRKLAVQDPVCMYLSPCPGAWKPITIHHLLTHTSGIPSYTGMPEYMKTMMMPKTIEQMVAAFRDLPLEFAPGERFKYNNSGYFLLGVIVEKVTGKRYEEVLRDEIFAPLGMADTGYDWPAAILPRRASGYARRDGAIVNASPLDMQQPYAAGSLYSTVGDLLTWDQALYGDAVLSAAARAAMNTPHTDNYGYGVGVRAASAATLGHAQIAHGGGINGFATMLTRVPGDRVTVIVLSNTEFANAGAIARDLLAINYGAEYKMPGEPAATR